jgi:predicted RND superfamily exporter protein
MSTPDAPQDKKTSRFEALSGFGEPMFRGLSRLINRAWLLILMFAVVATAGSVELARRLKLDTDVMALLPSDDPVVADVQELSKLFGASNELVGLVKRDEDMADDLAKEFMDHYAGLLGQSPLIESVEYKLPTLSLEEEKKRIEEKFEIGYIYYTTPEKDSYLMFISLKKMPASTRSANRLMEKISGIEREARKKVKGNVTGLTIQYAGGFAITLEEWKAMERILQVTALGSLGCALLLFALVFKRVTTAVYVGIALAMGILWTVALAYLVIGSLNLMTVAFAAILAGLGIDFGIHVSNRFLFERASHEDPHVALTNTLVTTGEGIMFSCLTTALAFFSLMLTDFDGASQFGFLVGSGVVLCAAAMLVVLPSLMLMTAIIFKKRPTEVDSSGLKALSFALQKQGPNMALVVILAIAIWQFFVFSEHDFPEFDNRLDNLTSKGNPALEIQKSIQRRFGNYFEPVGIVARHKDPDEAIRLLRKATEGLDGLTEKGMLARFECIFKYIPSAQKREFLAKAMKRRGNPERALNYLLKKLKGLESKKDEYDIMVNKKEEILHLLRSDLSLESLDYKELKEVLPTVLFEKFFAHDDSSGDHLSVCYAYPTTRIDDEEQIEELSSALGIDGKNLRLVGMSLMTTRLERLIQEQFRVITVFIAGVLALMLAFICRRLHLVILSVVPLLLSLVATITAMVVFDLKLNYMNIVAFPLILGMGIDNSIHMLYRYFEEGKRSVSSTIGEAGKAIALTSLTTIAGFASLTFTEHNGLISLGILTSIGIGTCFLTTVLVLPGLLMVFDPPK